MKWNGEVAVDADQALFSFTVKNESNQSITLEFPTSQSYDYSVYNAAGRQVYRFGEGKMFLQALQSTTLNSREQFQLKSTWNYNSNEAGKVHAGVYSVIAILTIRKINGELVHSKPSTLFTFYLPPIKTPFE
ncbi:BsuPI-related putative proteinase inhibitor [Sporosarcina sp. NPDC096371]|uniref:BsuPI-related putative proteinase inhibitor n=1 Tax=Sporosarcina sp. NPDC096371 TaxID=3364530 RepID=UPI0038029BA1